MVQLNNDWSYHRYGDVWVSDRFIRSFDSDKKEYYIEDKYNNHRYYESDWNYHLGLVSLLNDRQGYINYILGKIKEKISDADDNYDLYTGLYDELTSYKELWECD